LKAKMKRAVKTGTSEMEVLRLPYWGVKFRGER
jgi:hypothetical protein